jgi:hypothetical protein
LSYESGLAVAPVAFGISVPVGTLERQWGGDVIDMINRVQDFRYNESG